MKNSSSFLKEYGSTNFITGMRAFAALAVMLIHCEGGGPRQLRFFGNHFVDFCANGVVIFFVISGFSVAHAYSSLANFGEYLAKRLTRIVPLYYLWLFICILFSLTSHYWQEELNAHIDIYNVLMHLTFLSVFDYRITNTIIGVEWSIPIEIFWYLLIPPMLSLIKNWRINFIFIVLSFVLVAVGFKYTSLIFPSSVENTALAFHWSPIPYFFTYVLGITAYRLRKILIVPAKVINISLIIIFISLLIYGFDPRYILFFFWKNFWFASIIAFVMVSICSDRAVLVRWFLCNKVIVFLGTISYGLYLSHSPILSLLAKLNFSFLLNPTIKFFCVLGLSTLASTITYLCIERPIALYMKNSNNIFSRLLSKLRKCPV